jgi:hypothetical protein
LHPIKVHPSRKKIAEKAGDIGDELKKVFNGLVSLNFFSFSDVLS